VLLDKIREYKEVILTLTKITMERPRPQYFCSTFTKSTHEAYEVKPRVTEEYKLLLEQYKKEGLETTFKDQFDVLY
jgi:hypothetical protein